MDRFSLDSYEHLLGTLTETGRDWLEFTGRPGRGVLLRLDVDFDLGWAAEAAAVNAARGARGTFFVQVSSPMYSPLTPDGRRALGRIVDAGQCVGLHYRPPSPALDASDLRRHFEVLAGVCPKAQPVVAWHNPGDRELTALNEAAAEAGFRSAYCPQFMGPQQYISDSNCRRSPEALENFVRESGEPTIHMLLHPLIWVLGGDDMEDVLRQAAARKIRQWMDFLSDNNSWRNGLGEEISRRVDECFGEGDK